MKNFKSSLTPRYACIQGFFWMSFAAVMGFTSIYLLDAGFTNTQIGLLIAAAGTISAFLQPVLAGYADKPDSPSLKTIVLILTVVLLSSSALLFLLYHRSMLLTGFLFGICITVLQLLTPFMNALGMETINQGKKLNFGVSRGMGSVAYALASYALGAIAAAAGAVAVPVTMILVYIAFLIAVVCFPFTKIKKSPSAAERGTANPLAFFRQYRRFSIVLIGWMLLYISHVLLNSFTFQIIETKGGGSSEMGISMALSALIELPTLFLFGYMVKKVRCDIWVRISGIFFMLKALGSLLVTSILPFYFVQILQIGGWALITVASVYYVNSIMKEQDAIKGQAYFTMTYTFGCVLGSLLGGFLIDKAGVNAMLMFSAGAAFIGMLIVLFSAERTEVTV